MIQHVIGPLAAVLLAPLLPGIINRTKAFFAGRSGPPLLQRYYDIARQLRKAPVYSTTTTLVFKAGPLVGLAAILLATLLVPFGGTRAALSFSGDFLLFAYLLALARFFTVLAALDTGSAFEGMGASREVFFSALSELVLFLVLILLGLLAHDWSLSQMLGPYIIISQPLAWATFLFLAASLFVVILTENARVPVDDPNTHLELTMIHEVMVLDHSGPELGVIEYAASLKLWLLGLILVQLLNPFTSLPGALSYATSLVLLLLVAGVIGIVESVMARWQLARVPQLIAGAMAFAALGVIFYLR